MTRRNLAIVGTVSAIVAVTVAWMGRERPPTPESAVRRLIMAVEAHNNLNEIGEAVGEVRQQNAGHAAADRLLPLFHSADPVTVDCAVMSLGVLNVRRADVMDAFAEMLRSNNNDRAMNAGGSLAGLAPESLPTLHELLEDDDEGVRIRAASALSQVDDALEVQIIPSLLKAGTDESGRVRAMSIAALGTVKTRSDEVTEALIEAHTDPDPRVRAKAAFVLGWNAPATVDVLRALETLRDDEVTEVRQAADEAVQRLKGESPRK